MAIRDHILPYGYGYMVYGHMVYCVWLESLALSDCVETLCQNVTLLQIPQYQSSPLPAKVANVTDHGYSSPIATTVAR